MLHADRLPAIPLITVDPYFSVWMPGDTLTSATTIHWSGMMKPLHGWIVIDGATYCYLGQDSYPAMQTKELHIYPTRTVSVMEAAGIELTVTLWSPALPDDLEALSTPITFIDYSAISTDGGNHHVTVYFQASSALCFDSQSAPL